MAHSNRTKIYSYFGKEALAGGLNVSDNPLILSPSEMTEANDITIAQSLARAKRPGEEYFHLSSFASTASYPEINEPIRGLIQYWRYPSGVSQPVAEDDIFLHSANKVWSIENRTSPAIDRSGAFSYSTTGIPSYQVFEGILYFCSTDTADGYRKWNGVTSTPGDAEAATPPPDGPGKYLGTFQGRMVMGGNPSFPFRLYISAPLDAEDWASAAATSLDFDYDGDPEGITAIFPPLDGRLFIATRRSIYELTASDPNDLNTYFVRRATKGIGCVGGKMYVATPNDIVFWSDRGLHSLAKIIVSDQTEITFLSREIQTLVTQQLAGNLINRGQMEWDEVENLIVTTVASSGQLENDTILTYNMTFNTWTVWTGVTARSLTTYINSSNKQVVMFGREDGNLGLFNKDLTTRFGEGFSANFKTGKLFPGGNIGYQKVFRKLTVLLSSSKRSQIQINWTVDNDNSQSSQGTETYTIGDTSSLLGSTFILGQSTLGFGRFIPFTLEVGATGYNIQFEIVVTGDGDFDFYGFTVEVEDAYEAIGSS